MKIKILSNGVAVLDNDSHVAKWIEETGRLDHDQWLLSRVLPHIKEGAYVVDCGALYGDHTIAYSNKVGDNGIVLAFECNPFAFECLCHNMRSRLNVRIVDAGLYSRCCQAVGELSDNVGASTFREIDEIDEDSVNAIFVTLDSMQLERLDFIKMDCEGLEMHVINGGEETLIKFRPKMLIEINKGRLEVNGFSPSDIYQWLGLHDYTFHAIQPNMDLYHSPQFDILCEPL